METRKTMLGPEHPDTLTNMWNLAHSWNCQDRCSEVIALLELCVQLQEKHLGLTHPHTIQATSNYSPGDRLHSVSLV